MKKRIASLFLGYVVFCCSVFAIPSDQVMQTAVVGTYDGLLSAVASYASVPQISLQGVTVIGEEGHIPSRISFVRSDIANYRDSFSFFLSQMQPSWYSRWISQISSALSPLSSVAIESLDRRDYRQGDFIIDGTVYIRNSNDIELSSFVGKDLSSVSVLFSVSLIISGKMLEGESILIDGDFEIKGSSDCKVQISSSRLELNGNSLTISPMVISFAM